MAARAAPGDGQRIFAIVVAHNGATTLERCLTHLCECDCHVVVVDNASQDATWRILAKFPQITVIRQSRNLGFGLANNLGLRHALAQGASACLLVNQDAYLSRADFDCLARAAQSSPEYALLTPIHWTGDGQALDPGFLYYLQHAESGALLTALLQGSATATYAMEAAPAACWWLARECLERVGGFCPLFFMYGEDDDYCNRVRYHGLRVGVVPQARLLHDRASASAGRQPWRGMRWRIRYYLLPDLLDPHGKFLRHLALFCLDVAYKLFHALMHRLWREAIALLWVGLSTLPAVPYFWRVRLRHRRIGRHWLD
ncbi:MAG: glycosyltransferase family 2 protein [Anaerolineae bacterium]|nr:glycosyltransferase family 2 protein [Anaerolineae bacterium]